MSEGANYKTKSITDSDSAYSSFETSTESNRFEDGLRRYEFDAYKENFDTKIENINKRIEDFITHIREEINNKYDGLKDRINYGWIVIGLIITILTIVTPFLINKNDSEKIKEYQSIQIDNSNRIEKIENSISVEKINEE